MYEFTVEVDGKNEALGIRDLGIKEQQEANNIQTRAFSEALNNGAILRAKLDDVAREQGLWDDTKEARIRELRSKINQNEMALRKGKIKLSAAKQRALDIVDNRQSIADEMAPRLSLDANTAEGKAENERFNYLVSALVVYKDTGRPYFNGYEDYLNRANEISSFRIAQEVSKFLYGTVDDAELPENKFLKEFGFVDEDLRLINEDGHLVDRNGRLINEEGRWVDEKGNWVDEEGNLLDDDGNYKVEFSPFLDDDGNPIGEVKKKRGRKPKVETTE